MKNNYLSDLNSQTAEKKNRELEELGLPRLPQFRDQFLDLYNRLRVWTTGAESMASAGPLGGPADVRPFS